jgi:hypothetical protein
MSATDPGLTAPSLRRLPFTIRLAPQFVNRLLSRRQQSTASPDSIHGLLFGIADENLLVVQAFRSFAAIGERNARESELFDSLLASVHKDPEILPLELIGWYTVRASGGLLQSDIQFHNLHFQHPNNLALVLKPEGNSSVLMELYCRSADGVLSSEGHRWGAVRQALGSTLVGPIEVTMRSKIQDDFFLRAYQASSPEEESGSPGWKGTIQLGTRKALGWLTVSRSEKGPSNDRTAQALSKTNEPSVLHDHIQPGQSAMSTSRHSHVGTRESKPVPPPAIAPRQQQANPLSPQRENRAAALSPPIHAGAPPSVPALIPEAPGRRNVPWISSALVFAVAAGLTFGLVYSRGLSSGDYIPGFLKGFFPAPGLGLRLESQGDRLLLSWNRHHPAVRNSKGGLLQIDDGPRHRQVVLDAAQVLNGSVLYRPTSDDVTFRLEVEGLQDGKVSETMRVLEAVKPGTLDLSAPPAAVNAVPSTDRSVGLQEQPGSGVTGRTATMPPTQTSTAIVARRLGGTTADSPVVNAPPVSRPSSPPAVDTQPAPPPHTPLDLPPVKKEAEAQGQVNFDVVPATPVQAGKSESATPTNSSPASSLNSHPTEIVRSTPPVDTNPAPAPVIEKQKPEKQNPLPTPSSAPPLNTTVSKAPPTTSVLGTYHAPRPLRQVLPNTSLLPPGVLALAGRVEVIVKVDETGHVTEAHAVNGAKKVNPTLVGASLLAAKQWAFAPATINGRPVPSEHSVVFQFQAPK